MAGLHILGVIGGVAGMFSSCFTGDMLVDVEGGKKRAEEIVEGDRIWSRHEDEPDGPLSLKAVEEVFVRVSPILNVYVAGQVLRTTGEHPFWVENRGEGGTWLAARDMSAGDWLRTRDGSLVAVEGLEDSGLVETVYNWRIADYHTYYVGVATWSFSVWCHNSSYQGHHSDPMFMGGRKKQPLTPLGTKTHQQLHKDLNKHLETYTDVMGNTMRPSSINPGRKIRRNFSRDERLQALSNFYKGPGAKYPKAAADFFKQHPPRV